MAFVPITALPTAPSRTQQPPVFSANTDAFLTALPPLVTEINAGGAAIEASQTAASTSETNAATSETNAATSASGSASSANYVGLWSSLSGALNIPASVFHSDKVWSLKYNIANVAASQPGVSSDWVAVSFVVTTSSTDTTAGRITNVGYCGLGDSGVTAGNFDTETPNGFYRFTGAGINATPSFAAQGVNVNSGSTAMRISYGGSNWADILFSHVGGGTVYTRVNDGGVLRDWAEMLTAASTTAGTQITYNNAGTQTFTRQAVNTYINRYNIGSVTYTFALGSFNVGDKIYVSKAFDRVGTITVQVQTGELIFLPDGVGALFQTLEVAGGILLEKVSSTDWIVRAA